MKKQDKIIIWLIVFIVILSFIIIPLVFWNNFKEFTVSMHSEHWGQLWDFFWWLLNPIIGLANLWVLIWLSFSIAKIEEWREAELLKKQVKPFLRIDVDANANDSWIYEDLYIRLKNSWLWPLVFKKIEIVGINGEVYEDFSNIRDTLISPGWYSHMYFHDNDGVLSEGESIILFSIIKNKDTKDDLYVNRAAKVISSYILKFTYEDIYGTKFTKEKDLVKWLKIMKLI